MSRFIDSGEFLADFGEMVIASCPRCQRPVNYQIDTTGKGIVYPFSCLNCGYIKGGHTKDFLVNPMSVFVPTHQLYLVADCCGQTLWARNMAHLDFLENYVSANLRQRTANVNRSVASRLPQWIKAAKNREEILKCIKRLREKYVKEKQETVT